MCVVLAPGIEVCQHRNSGRDPCERFEFDGYEDLNVGMRREMSDVGRWLDTAALAAEQTADRIIREAAHRAVVS